MGRRRPVPAAEYPFGDTEFRWEVCPDGYEWERHWSMELHRSNAEDVARPRWVLVPKSASRSETRPLEIPDLLRRLAACPTSRDGVRAFADQHGVLGLPVAITSEEYKIFTPLDEVADPEDHWYPNIAWARAAIGVLDALSGGAIGELSRWVMTDAEAFDKNRIGRAGGENYVSRSWMIGGQEDRGAWTLGMPLNGQLGDEHGINRVTARAPARGPDHQPLPSRVLLPVPPSATSPGRKSHLEDGPPEPAGSMLVAARAIAHGRSHSPTV